MRFRPKIREKRWSIEREKELRETWEKEDLYRFDPDDDERPMFIVDTPPPYASGKWHVGAAAHYAHIDMIARAHRMMGYNVLVPFYADRNGLPVEVQVEKIHGIRARDVPREKFIELCKEFLDRVEQELVEIVKRMGFSFDIWSNGTDSPAYRALTQATFIELFKKGLIYEASRPNNYCPRCRTTLADAELEYKEAPAKLYYLKFRSRKGGKEYIIATTRPELLSTCVMVIFNPEDERYKGLENDKLTVPIYGHEVPVRPHPYAKPEFGTGLVMICAFGDINDVRIIRELGLKYKIAINEDGLMNENAGPYAGLSVKEARRKIVEDLKNAGLLVKEEEIRHNIPVCWRCKTPIEYIAMKEYYLKQVQFKEELLKLIEKVDFYPPESKRLLVDWINSVTSDWPISRRRIYATEIPIWYCEKCGTPHLPQPGRYYQPWREPAPFKKCVKCGHNVFVPELRVFDTWMDSSISPLYVSGYGRNSKVFNKGFPVALRPQGKDIVRTWLYYTFLRVYQLTGKPAFKRVRITGMGLDEKGEAMHKSKGNVIDPIPMLDKYGADALRFWAAAEAKLGSDYRFSEQHVETGSLFITKIWNIARFISQFPYPSREEVLLTPTDEMVLAKLNDVIEKVLEAYREMDVYVPANELFRFTWHIFADHYIEAVKPRAYNREGVFNDKEQKAAWYTLHTVLSAVIRMLAPIMPFVTDAIWRAIYSSKSVHVAFMPGRIELSHPEYGDLLEKFMEFNRMIWRYKKEKKIALNQVLRARVYVSEELRPLERDIKAMHRIEVLCFGKPTSSETVVEIGAGIYVDESWEK